MLDMQHFRESNSLSFILKRFEKKESCFRKPLSDRWGTCLATTARVTGARGCQVVGGLR